MDSQQAAPGSKDDSGVSQTPPQAQDGLWASTFTHIPHPHIAHRKDAGPVKVKDQMDTRSPIARINSRLGLLITIAVGSMWAAYIFTLLALISLPAAIQSGDKIIIVAWIAQTFLQLVLLPVIIVGQNLQSAASDKRAEQTYNDAEAVLHEAMQIQEHLKAQDAQLQAQSQRLQEIVETLAKAYPRAAGELRAGATE
jgi:hypothetical protein